MNKIYQAIQMVNNIVIKQKAFKIYGENYKRSEEIKKKYERGNLGEINNKSDLLAERPGAMRAWISKWDPDYNVTFKSQGNVLENHN